MERKSKVISVYMLLVQGWTLKTVSIPEEWRVKEEESGSGNVL